MKLYELSDDIELLERMLLQDDVDEDSFRKALDGLNQQREAKIANIGLLIKHQRADNDARAEAIKQLQAAKKATDARMDWLKRYIAAHIDKPVKTPLVTVAKQRGRERVVVESIALLPEELVFHPPPEPDKAEILKRLKAGEAIPGARLERGDDFVTIR